MVNKADIGKWLAYVIIGYIAVFLILSVFNFNTALDKFIGWSKDILIYLVGGGIIIYIVINVVLKRRK